MKIINDSDEYYFSDEEDEITDRVPKDSIDIDQLIDFNNYIVSKLKHYCYFNGLSLLIKDTLDITSLIKL